MVDVWEIRQGMIIFLPDMSEGHDVIFKGEQTPKKRRPWLIVSNDSNNIYSTQVSAVPIYTRKEATLPTQVYFKNGDRDQVVCCESVTCIPKTCIDLRGFSGFVSPDVFKKVQEALSVQFGNTTPGLKTAETLIQQMLDKVNIQDLVGTKLCEILINGLTNRSTIETHITPIIDNKKIDEPIISEMTTIDNKSSVEFADTVTVSTKKTPVSDIDIPKKVKGRGPRGPYGSRGKNMTLEECMTFYLDTDTLTTEQLCEKWGSFGVKNDKLQIGKKKSAIKKRLVDNNLL